MESSKYEIQTLLGKGRTGGVYLAEDTSTEKIIAIRRFFLAHSDDNIDWNPAFSNVDPGTLHQTFPNTLPIIDSGIDEDGPFLVYPHLENAKRASKLIRSNHTFSFQEFHHIAKQLLEALSSIHKAGLIHGLIQTNSILLTINQDNLPQATLTDWSIQQITEQLIYEFDEDYHIRELVMTAPEILKGKALSPLSDVYALGNLLYALWHHRHRYTDLSANEIIKKIKSSKTKDTTSTSLPKEFNTWLQKLIEPNPAHRTKDGIEALESLPPLETKPEPAKLATKTAAPKIKKYGTLLPLSIATVLLVTLVTLAITRRQQDDTDLASTPTQNPPTPKKETPTQLIPQKTTPTKKTIAQSRPPKPKPPTTTAKTTPTKKEEPTVLKITPVKPTAPPMPIIEPAPPIQQPITMGNYTLHPPLIHTQTFTNPDTNPTSISIDQPKTFSWIVLDSTSIEQAIRGSATTKLNKMISVSQQGDFKILPIKEPRATYNIKGQSNLREASYADGTHSKLKPGQGWRIAINMPHLGSAPINVTIDTRAGITDIDFKITDNTETPPFKHTLPFPQEAHKAISAGPAYGIYHSQQTITINNPVPKSIIYIDVTIGQTYLKDSIYKDSYSLGLNAITIWRP